MSLKKTLTAVRFAHLLGIRASQAEDDEMKQGADESDEDYAKRMEEDEKKKDDEAKKAEEDEEKKDDEAKKAKKAEEDKEKSKADGNTDDEDDKEKAARKSERARCAAIFASPAAGVRPDVAAHLAFSTDMSSADAISMLQTVSAGAVPVRGLASRMATVAIPNVGDSGGAAPSAGGAAGIAAQIVAAGKKRRGES